MACCLGVTVEPTVSRDTSNVGHFHYSRPSVSAMTLATPKQTQLFHHIPYQTKYG